MKCKAFEIEKNGKKRIVFKLSDEENQKHRELAFAYGYVLDCETNDRVCSYGKGCSTLTTVDQVARSIKGYEYFLKLDVEDYFNRINRKLLAARLDTFLPPQTRQYFMNCLCISPYGIPTGSPLSPKISNMFLKPFDDFIDCLPNTMYWRYGDSSDKLVYPTFETAA
jgi:retron-type reverse transcriptase